MKKCIPCLIFCFLLLARQKVYGQTTTEYPQQQADFKIAVRLTPENHTLDGFETIKYTNNSPDTLHFIWFHIWANAYKNDRTAFSEHRLKERKTDFYFSGIIQLLNCAADKFLWLICILFLFCNFF